MIDNKYQLFTFNLGIFFLLSAPAISLILFLVSIILTSLKAKKINFFSKWDIPFIASTLLTLLSVTFSTFFLKNSLPHWQNNLNWLGIVNWVPFFLCFFCFRNLTNSSIQRKRIIIFLLSGSVPLLITGFGQLWFNWYGPFSLFGNFIVWFQRPIGEGDISGMSGLFSNPNYAAAWLLVIWPMILGLINQKIKNKFKKTFLLSFLFSLFISILLTRSRSAWFGATISIPLIFKNNLFLAAIPGLILIFFIVIIVLKTFLPAPLDKIFTKIIPNIISSEFLNTNLTNLGNYPRIIIWNKALNYIFERPLFGWGAASFPYLMSSASNENIYQHTHNLILELAISYGLPVAIIFFITLFIILFKSFKIIYINSSSENYLERAWWTSTFTLLLSQLVDLQYFDLRISLSFWILVAGLVSIIEGNKKN